MKYSSQPSAVARRDANERLHVTAWRPDEAGDHLEGTIVGLEERRGSGYSGPYQLVLLETADGERVEWHASHVVARDELSKLNPKVGDCLGIFYLGTAESKSAHRKPYHKYRLAKASAGTSEWSIYSNGTWPAETFLLALEQAGASLAGDEMRAS